MDETNDLYNFFNLFESENLNGNDFLSYFLQYDGIQTLKYLNPKFDFVKEIFQTKITNKSLNIHKFLEILILLERKHLQLFSNDPEFVLKIIYKFTNQELKEILLNIYKITPIIIEILKVLDDSNDLNRFLINFYIFLQTTKMDFKEAFIYLNNHKIDVKILQNSLLNSSFVEIRNLYHLFVNYYPETLTFYSFIDKNNRELIFENPLFLLSLLNTNSCNTTKRNNKLNCFNYKLIRTYIDCINIYLQQTKKDTKNMDILLKTIIFYKILNFKNICCRKLGYKKIIHPLIIECPILVNIIVRRKFNENLMKEIIDFVPSFHISFDISLKFVQNSIFHKNLCNFLLQKYPVPENIEKAKKYKIMI
ncbi:hypothetical protein CWI39_1708p0020 [Hamiltosporidium magnivora]|uniref:Uncharacterized protein n=1 Tax=Hamiltosporidium magnivora TaxID=148818 RepID=A0A4Q9KZA7_9MICR|nr:hypothetical protein CWI39_1708p0020 [Hamiltosporidium magnivora]